MAQWYYVDKNQQRVGPMEPTVLVDALRHGQLHLNSMVWNEQMPAWQPLSMHLDALRVPEALRLRSKPGKGNKVAVWLIVLVVCGFLAVALLGILAAIALPAYQDYTVRAKLAGLTSEAATAKIQVAQYVAEHSACPNNKLADGGMPTPESYASPLIKRIDIGALENGNCALEVSVPDTLVPGQVSGTILFELIDAQTSQWQCSSTSIKDRYLPIICRSGGNQSK